MALNMAELLNRFNAGVPGASGSGFAPPTQNSSELQSLMDILKLKRTGGTPPVSAGGDPFAAFQRTPLDIFNRQNNPAVGGLVGIREQGGQIPGRFRESELGRLAFPQAPSVGRGLNGSPGRNNLGNRIPEFLRRV